MAGIGAGRALLLRQRPGRLRGGQCAQPAGPATGRDRLIGTETGHGLPARVFVAGLARLADGFGVEVLVAHAAATELDRKSVV